MLILAYQNPCEIQSNGIDWNEWIQAKKIQYKLPRTRLKLEIGYSINKTLSQPKHGGSCL